MLREPLVSCVLRARAGSRAAARAIDWFLRQNYGPRELILVDDSAEPGEFLAPDGRIRYFQLPDRLPASELRNFACHEARGDIVALWDERAWYAPEHLLSLVDALLREESDAAGPERAVFCDLEDGQAWECPSVIGGRLRFAPGAVAFRLAWWQSHPFRSSAAGFDEAIEFERARVAVLGEPVSSVCFGLPPLQTPRAAFDLASLRRLLGGDSRLYWPAEPAGEPPELADAPEPAALPENPPLVSAILLARDARSLPAAAELFLRQDYEPKEIVVVDPGGGLRDLLPSDERVRYVAAEPGISAGAARNLACEHARGEFIAHWDERDWQAPSRLRAAVASLSSEQADLCGANVSLVCDLQSRQGWLRSYPVEGGFRASGGSLCYRRSLWEKNLFPDTDAGENARFAWRAHSARRIFLAGARLQVSFARGEAGPYSYPFPFPEIGRIAGEDWSYFEPELPLNAAPREHSKPLVSCILPARSGDGASLAIEYFLRQDYEPRELVVLDSSPEPLQELIPADPRIRYVRLTPALLAGAEFNTGWEHARGDIVLHWHEGSWYAPDRLRRMIQPLLSGEADLCGVDPLLVLDLPSGTAGLSRRGSFRFHPSSHAYRRSLGPLLTNLSPARIAVVADWRCQVLMLAGEDEAAAALAGARCEPYEAGEVRRLLGDDWYYYERETRPGARPPAMLRPPAPPAELPPPQSPEAPPAPAPVPSRPLVSCIMPTRDRPGFARRATEYFLRQDYPNCELIVVDDGLEPVGRLLPQHPRIRYIRREARMPLGAKRNLACQEAHGEFVAHWDDDDWQAPHRIRVQVETLENAQADLCGIGSLLVFEPRTGRAWSYRCPLVEDSFWAAGTSLCYRRALWERNPFAEVDLAEDRQFLWNAAPARMVDLPDTTVVVAMLHDRNTAPLVPGGTYWTASETGEVRRVLGRDWDFYAAQEGALVPGPGPAALPELPAAPAPRPARVEFGGGGRPLVSCVMPTHNRRRFVPLAIQFFLRQEYEPKQLIVLDDGSDRVESLVPNDDRFVYLRVAGRLSLGAKRNLACGVARGDIILHWDDDDWHAPSRIAYMTDSLLGERADLCGLNPLYFFDIRSQLAWLYRYPQEQRFWVAGTSFCYRRSFWERNRFADIDVGEDNRFLWDAPPARMIALPDSSVQVAILHDGNGSPKAVGDEYWQAHPSADIRWLLGPDWDFYRFEPPLPRLNLGCGDAHVPGLWNVDVAAPADQIVDLSCAWPWVDSSVDFILARDVIEHLPDKIQTMNEAWRVLRPGGSIEITVPTTSGSGAFQDPTHKSFWNRRGFLYFEAGNPYRERFAWSYGISAAFRTISERADQSEDGERLTIVLEAVK